MNSREYEYDKMHSDIEELIKPKGAPVGIKMFEDEVEYDRLKIKPPERKLALCQILKLSSIYERTLGVKGENVDACVVGSYVLGLLRPPADLEERWIKGFDYTREKFESLVKGVHALPMNKYKAAVIAPLRTFHVRRMDPDVIFMPINSAQAYLLLVGYFDATGDKPSSDFNGHAACEVIAAAMNKGRPWLTIPCGGARSIAEAQDDELWIAMSPEAVDKTLKRLNKVGLKYPPPVFQMLTIEPDPEHPLTHLIRR